MLTFALRRLLTLIPTWLGISFLAFSLATLSPGDPAQLILNRDLDQPPTQQQLDDFRERNGLNDPFLVQYGAFVGDVVTGDLGTSFRTQNSVRREILSRFGPTLQIAIPAFLMSAFSAVVFGVLAALKRNSVADNLSRGAALIFESVPSFALAYLLIIVLAVKLGWFPVAGTGTPQHFVLPVLTLTLATLSSTMRLTWAIRRDVLGQDYIRTAHAMGIPRRRVVMRLALRNALIPVVTVAALILAGFITGTVIIEIVFAWPGIGRYIVDAVFDRDYPVITGFVVFTGTVFVLVNLLVDLLYVRLDPRVRLTGSGRSANA